MGTTEKHLPATTCEFSAVNIPVTYNQSYLAHLLQRGKLTFQSMPERGEYGLTENLNHKAVSDNLPAEFSEGAGLPLALLADQESRCCLPLGHRLA